MDDVFIHAEQKKNGYLGKASNISVTITLASTETGKPFGTVQAILSIDNLSVKCCSQALFSFSFSIINTDIHVNINNFRGKT